MNIFSNDHKRCNIRLNRLSKIPIGITLVSIDNSNSLLSSINNEENINFIRDYSYCNILQYEQMQSILIIYQNNKTNRNDKIHLFVDLKNKIDKLAGIYNDY